MKVALVHYWLLNNRGGEKVLEALCRLFPEAVIFTHVLDQKVISPIIARHEIRTTFIDRLPWSKRLYQAYLPLMPAALEELDLREFDLVVSSEAGPAKGVVTRPDAVHVCYCHSPMRYIWDLYPEYRSAAGFLARTAMSVFGPSLRRWDVTSSARVDQFVANSRYVASRIRKYYRREAVVIHPPVDLPTVKAQGSKRGDEYLWLGELAAYKRPDLAIEAISRSGRKMIVAGDGPLLGELRRRAGSSIVFLERVQDRERLELLSSCRALIFPGLEDFGLVPVEAMAAGLPVIGYARGGILDSLGEGVTGVLFHEQSVEGLVAAINRFESTESNFEFTSMLRHARKFGPDVFDRSMVELIRAATA